MIVIWNSREIGTYVKAVDGAIGTQYKTGSQKRKEKREAKEKEITV